MDKFIAKIDAIFATITGSKVLEAINALIGYLGKVVGTYDKEAGDILTKVYGWGEKE